MDYDPFQRADTTEAECFQDWKLQLYRHLRNKVNKVNKSLTANYYKSKVEHLKDGSARKWWHSVKELTGASHSGGNELDGLANKLTDGNREGLANKINVFFKV